MADLATTLPLTRSSVEAARDLIASHVHLTPVLTNTTLTTLASTPRSAEDLVGTRWEGRTPAKPNIRLWFKCENLQRVGAFKPRGAFHAVERLKKEPGWVEGGGMEKGVVTHSSGLCSSVKTQEMSYKIERERLMTDVCELQETSHRHWPSLQRRAASPLTS